MPKGRGFRRKHLMSKKQPSHTLVTNVDSLQKRCNEALKSVAGHQKSVDTLLGCASRDPSTLMQTRMYLHTRPQPSPPDNLNPDTSLQDLQKLDELNASHVVFPGLDIDLQLWRDLGSALLLVDPTTQDALINFTEKWDNVPLPGASLRRLPFANPIFALPSPLLFRGNVKNGGPQMAAHDLIVVTGYTAKDSQGMRWACSSADSTAEILSCTLLGRVYKQVGGLPQACDLPVAHGAPGETRNLFTQAALNVDVDLLTDDTVEARVASHMETMTVPPGLFTPQAEQRLKEQQRSALMTIYTLLAYTVMANTEVEEVNTTATPQRTSSKKRTSQTQKTPRRNTNLVMVGAKIGANIRQRYATASASGTGSKKRPHVRRGHLHRYRVGPRDGDVAYVAYWQPPTFVGATEVPPELPTVRHV